jgi:hypothetical protein
MRGTAGETAKAGRRVLSSRIWARYSAGILCRRTLTEFSTSDGGSSMPSSALKKALTLSTTQTMALQTSATDTKSQISRPSTTMIIVAIEAEHFFTHFCSAIPLARWRREASRLIHGNPKRHHTNRSWLRLYTVYTNQ